MSLASKGNLIYIPSNVCLYKYKNEDDKHAAGFFVTNKPIVAIYLGEYEDISFRKVLYNNQEWALSEKDGNYLT